MVMMEDRFTGFHLSCYFSGVLEGLGRRVSGTMIFAELMLMFNWVAGKGILEPEARCFEF
jgi:hypothetical protein